MDSASINIKEEIHQLINNIDDLEFLKAVQTIISAKTLVESGKTQLSQEEMQIVEEREAEYLAGKSKTYTWEEVKSRLKPAKNV